MGMREGERTRRGVRNQGIVCEGIGLPGGRSPVEPTTTGGLERRPAASRCRRIERGQIGIRMSADIPRLSGQARESGGIRRRLVLPRVTPGSFTSPGRYPVLRYSLSKTTNPLAGMTASIEPYRD